MVQGSLFQPVPCGFGQGLSIFPQCHRHRSWLGAYGDRKIIGLTGYFIRSTLGSVPCLLSIHLAIYLPMHPQIYPFIYHAPIYLYTPIHASKPHCEVQLTNNPMSLQWTIWNFKCSLADSSITCFMDKTEVSVIASLQDPAKVHFLFAMDKETLYVLLSLSNSQFPAFPKSSKIIKHFTSIFTAWGEPYFSLSLVNGQSS